MKPITYRPNKYDAAIIEELLGKNIFDNPTDMFREALKEIAIQRIGLTRLKEITFETFLKSDE